MVRVMLAFAACGCGGDPHPVQPPAPVAVVVAPAPAPPVDAAPVPDMPDDCVQYVAAIDRMSHCDKLPPDSRKAVANAKQTIVGSFATGGLSPEALAAMGGACKQGNDAIQQAIVKIGC